ncbi:tail sheath protein [Bacillus phage vB_BcM_Sam46]|uniref:Tail sheath protein n=1 Tax=Bacillus phage vB_BcM_Sam46 TaxID=2719179 RepID=A0A6G9L6M9_9CAUD|nr:tail sheath protein [Bacillus phage vB_BcM_Sam46]
MANRYVNVVISRQTQPVARQGFGMPLVVATEKALSYKEYTTLAEVGADLAESTETYKLVQALFAQTPRPAKVAIVGVVFTEGTTEVTALTDLLNTTRLSKDEWYYLLSAAQAEATVTALSSWAAANGKFYFLSTSSKTLSGTLNSDHTVVMVHPTPKTYPAAAWVGACSPKDVGSFTWTFKTLNGIAPAGYTQAEIDEIEAAKGSTYIKEAGVNITSKGQTTSGEYIDIVQGQDYISSRMAEDVFGLFTRTDKVPFTAQGIALIVAEVEKVLKQANVKGIIASDADGKPLYSVSAPDITEVSQNDKAKRTLPNLKWTATLAGAIEDVDIQGTLIL